MSEALIAVGGFLNQTPASLPIFLGEEYEDHVSAWIQTRGEISDRQWRLGAIVDSLERRYRQGSVEQFAHDVQESVKTLWDYGNVYRRFKNSERPDNLSWTHYRVALAAEEPEAVLCAAAEQGLSVRQMRKLIVQDQARKAIEQTDAPAVDPLWSEAAADWYQIAPQVERFVQKYPQFKLYAEDFLGDVQDQIENPFRSASEYLERLIDEGVRSLEHLAKITNWQTATLESLCDQLVNAGSHEWVAQGRTEGSRGAQVRLIAPVRE